MIRDWIRRFHPRRTLRRQLIATITGVHMLLMISFVYDLVDRQQSFLLERAKARVVNQAGALAASVVPQLATHDFAGLKEIIDPLARDKAIRYAAVTEPDGRVVWHSDPKQSRMGFFKDERSRKVLAGPRKASITYESSGSVQAAAPVMIENRLLGWAWLGGDLSEDRAQVLALRRTGVFYTLIAVGSGAIFALILASAITQQLRLLLAGTKRLAEDRLDEPVPVIADNEVGTVARAFNVAMRKLSEQRTELVTARNELEAEVAERRHAEQELMAANKAILSANEGLQQFSYAVSHDLQEPLRSIAGYSELLRRRYTGRLDEDADEFISYVYTGATRMQNLIRALLEYSRAGAPGGEPARDVDPNRSFAEALENLGTAIEVSGAVVTSADLPTVRAHEVALVQLFQNLVGNAIKYAGEQVPKIEVRAERQDTYWRFAISDNGVGLEPRDHQRVFGIFKRAHGEGLPGAGIGLAICSKIVERYGGRIWLDSERGRGSTFYFTLPAGRASKPAVQPSDKAAGVRLRA